LGSDVDRVDDGNARDRRNIHGLGGAEYPGADRKPKPSRFAPYGSHPDRPDWDVGLLLAALHGVEAALWAAAYWWLGALSSPTDAVLYSVDSMSTLGASGLTVEPHWRMMGALEGMDGMLLFGISTAYIFAIMQAYWSLMTRGRPH
jgi:hypothetical protein